MTETSGSPRHEGAQRYDGIRWTTYTTKDGLPDKIVLSVTQTRDGAMWFGTIGGHLTRFDPSVDGQDAWHTFDFDNPDAQTTPSLLQTRDGTLWVGVAAGGGLWRFDGTTWTRIEHPPGFSGSAYTLFESADGAIWLTSWSEWVLRFDPSAPVGQSAWTHYASKDGLVTNRVSSILQTREGMLWFAGGVSTISRFDPAAAAQEAWKTHTVSDGLPESVLSPRSG